MGFRKRKVVTQDKLGAKCDMSCPACGGNAVLALSPRYDGPPGNAMVLWRFRCDECKTDSREMVVLVPSEDKATISIGVGTDLMLAMLTTIWESTTSGRKESKALIEEKIQYEKKGGILQ